ncbi:MAG: DUF2723 domain-containing protein [Chloroflexota bacterium]
MIEQDSKTKTGDILPYPLLLATFVTVLGLYLLTLAPGVVGGDAGEHQFAAPLLAIPHATGYPLYILLGKIWTLLIPIGSLAWRMNLLSAVGGALAATTTSLVVYRLAQDKYSQQISQWNAKHVAIQLSAFIAGLVLAFGLTLWQWSIIAGVRSINVLFFALLTLQAITWEQQLARGEQQRAERTLRWLALTVGLSLAHHRTTVFYLPPLVVWIWWHAPTLIRQPKRLLILAALTLTPLFLYILLYVRAITGVPYSHEAITDWQSFWFLVGASDSSGLFLYVDPAYLIARLDFIWNDILAQIAWSGVFLALVGVISLLRSEIKQFLLQGALVFLLFGFTLDFEVVNLNEAPTWYMMPAYFIFSVWVGLGLIQIYKWAHKINLSIFKTTPPTSKHHPLPIALLIVILLIFIDTLAWPNWQKIEADSTQPIDEWRQLLRGAQAERFVESSLPYLEQNSLLLGDWEQYTPFRYSQLIEGKRLDLIPRLPLDRWPEQVAQIRTEGRPVYLMRKTNDLIGTPYLSMAGPLVHLGTAPNRTIPESITQLNANFEDELELIGYRANLVAQKTPGGKQAGSIFQIQLYWRAPKAVDWDYALSFRLLDNDNQERYKRDTTHPVLSSYPTTLWTPNEVVGDFYEFTIPPDSETVRLHIIPYRTEGAGQWHNLSLDDGQEGIILEPFVER